MKIQFYAHFYFCQKVVSYFSSILYTTLCLTFGSAAYRWWILASVLKLIPNLENFFFIIHCFVLRKVQSNIYSWQYYMCRILLFCLISEFCLHYSNLNQWTLRWTISKRKYTCNQSCSDTWFKLFLLLCSEMKF